MAHRKSMRAGYKGGTSSGPSRSGHRKPPLTHFLCLPLVTDASRPQLEASISKFRDIVISNNEKSDSEQQIPLKAIRPVGTIHFTLGVMSLTSEDKVSEAVALLQTIDLESLMKNAMKGLQKAGGSDAWLSRLSLTSLHSMHSPTKTSVLYAGPEDPSGVLKAFCDKLRDSFMNAGFLLPDDKPLKLHATIVNTVYAKSEARVKNMRTSTAGASSATNETNTSRASEVGDADGPEGIAKTSNERTPRTTRPMGIDATGLINQCKDFMWASDFAIEKLAICKMGAKKIYDEQGSMVDEQYEEAASVPLSFNSSI